MRRAAAADGAKVVRRPGRDGAVIYAGEDPVAAAGVADGVARETPGARVVLPDAVLRAFFAPGARHTVAGPLSLDAAGQVAPARFTTFRLERGRRMEIPG